jgi:hypothetical protein
MVIPLGETALPPIFSPLQNQGGRVGEFNLQWGGRQTEKIHWNIRDMCRSWALKHHLTLRNNFIQVLLRFCSVIDKSTSSGESYKIYASRICSRHNNNDIYQPAVYSDLVRRCTQFQEEVVIYFCAVTSQQTEQRLHRTGSENCVILSTILQVRW